MHTYSPEDTLLILELNLTRHPTDMGRRAILRGCVPAQLVELETRFSRTIFPDDQHVTQLIKEELKRQYEADAELEERVLAAENE